MKTSTTFSDKPFSSQFPLRLLISGATIEMSLNGLHQVTGCVRYAGTGAVDSMDTRVVESLVVLRRNDTTTHDQNVTPAKRLQLLNHLMKSTCELVS